MTVLEFYVLFNLFATFASMHTMWKQGRLEANLEVIVNTLVFLCFGTIVMAVVAVDLVTQYQNAKQRQEELEP